MPLGDGARLLSKHVSYAYYYRHITNHSIQQMALLMRRRSIKSLETRKERQGSDARSCNRVALHHERYVSRQDCESTIWINERASARKSPRTCLKSSNGIPDGCGGPANQGSFGR